MGSTHQTHAEYRAPPVWLLKSGHATPHHTTPHQTTPHHTTPHHTTPHHTTPHLWSPRGRPQRARPTLGRAWESLLWGGLPAAHLRVAPRGGGAAPGRPLVGALPVVRGVCRAKMARNCIRATPPPPHPHALQHSTARHSTAQHSPPLLPKNQPTTLPKAPSLCPSCPKPSPQPYPTLPLSTPPALNPAHNPTQLSLSPPLLP